MIDNPDLIWEKITDILKAQFPVETFNLWFSPTKASSFTNNVLTIEVPNKYFADWMLKNKSYIDSAISSLPGLKNSDVHFIIRPDINAYSPPIKEEMPELVWVKKI